MADQPIHVPLDFSQALRLLETTDPAHADTFNPLFERLINNDAFLKAFAETLAKDIFAAGFIVSGMVATINGSTPTQLDVTAGVAYLQQPSGGLARFEANAQSFDVALASATYYLDIQPDGTYHWGTAHSAQANYLPVATVITTETGTIDTVTDNRVIKDTNVADKLAAHLAETVHIPYAVTSGSANTYTVTLNPAPTAYTEGMALAVKINVDNTGASAININGLGAKSIKKPNGNDVSAGNLKAGSIYTLRYNGVNFILQGEGGEYGTAQAPDVLDGKTIGTEQGLVTGTMPNQGQKILTPSNVDIIIPKGYHNGTGKVSKVTFDASKLLTGTTVAGTAGTMPNRGAPTWTPGTVNQNLPPGYYTGGTIKGDANLVASNIRSGKNIFGVDGSLVPHQSGTLIFADYWSMRPTYVIGYQHEYANDLEILLSRSYNDVPMTQLMAFRTTIGIPIEVSIVTDSPVDLTNFTQLAYCGYSRDMSWAYVCVSTSKTGLSNVYNARLTLNSYNPMSNILDVSNLSGLYYIRFHGIMQTIGTGNIYCFSCVLN